MWSIRYALKKNDHLTGDNDQNEWSETIRIGVPDFPTSQMIRSSCPVGLLETWMLPHSRPWPKQFLPRQSENLKIWNSLIYKETYDIKGHKWQIVHICPYVSSWKLNSRRILWWTPADQKPFVRSRQVATPHKAKGSRSSNTSGADDFTTSWVDESQHITTFTLPKLGTL